MEDDLLESALELYIESGARDQPSVADSTVEEHEGSTYAVLRNVNGVLAVCVLGGSDWLKRDHNPPEAVLA